MKINHMLAVTAPILIFAVTACTQYVFEFPTDKEITTVEDLVKFMQKHEKDSAKVNLTIDPDNSYLPITINDDKTITGKITIKEDSPFPFPFSSVTTYATKAGATNLFEIADNASLSVTNFEASVTSNAADSINAIIYVDEGEFNADSFTSSKSVTGLSIGPNAEASRINVNDSNIGIVIDEGNVESDKILDNITENNPDIPQEDITTRFDAANAEEFFEKLSAYKNVRLTRDINIEASNSVPEEFRESKCTTEGTYIDYSLKLGDSYTINLNGHVLSSTLRFCLPQATNNGYEVLIENGSLVLTGLSPWGENNSTIELFENSTLTLNNVNYSSNLTGIFLFNNNDNSTLNIQNSTVDVTGTYAIGTNATKVESAGLKLNIYNSKISTHGLNDTGKTGILFNVQGTIDIEDSEITGGAQAIIARGGNYTIKNTVLTATGENAFISPDNDFSNHIWVTGNGVPLAALTIGNRVQNNTYPYGTNVTLDNVTINAPLENTSESPVKYYGIFIWENKETEPVTVEGSIRRGNDCEVKNLYNTATNGAHVDITILN